jgi:hypothetical protein
VRDKKFARQEASTDGLLALARRGWPKKRSGSYVGVYKEPEVLLATKDSCQVGEPKKERFQRIASMARDQRGWPKKQRFAQGNER